jgi:hypothetical protein
MMVMVVLARSTLLLSWWLQIGHLACLRSLAEFGLS